MPYLKVQDGTEIFFNDWGTGKPVILIHGWPLSSASWEYQASFLANNGFRVITYDRRGFGKSSQPWSGYDYDTMASDLAALIDTLGLAEVALVGFSMGGGEVVRYMGRHGSAGKVSRVVLISAVPPYMLKTDDNPEGVEKKVFDEMVEGVQKDRPAFYKDFFPKFYGNSVIHHKASDAMLEFTQMMAMQASPKATVDCIRAFSETDFRDDCLGISVPALVIVGDKDTTVPMEVGGKRAAEMIPQANLLVYEGEAHALNSTAPDKLNADLLGFLR